MRRCLSPKQPHVLGKCPFAGGGGGGNLGCQKAQKKNAKKRNTHRAMPHMLIPNKAGHIQYHRGLPLHSIEPALGVSIKHEHIWWATSGIWQALAVFCVHVTCQAEASLDTRRCYRNMNQEIEVVLNLPMSGTKKKPMQTEVTRDARKRKKAQKNTKSASPPSCLLGENVPYTTQCPYFWENVSAAHCHWYSNCAGWSVGQHLDSMLGIRWKICSHLDLWGKL